MTFDINTFADSAEEDNVSNNESCITVSSDGDAGGLTEGMSE
jgi:hypothetical protein